MNKYNTNSENLPVGTHVSVPATSDTPTPQVGTHVSVPATSDTPTPQVGQQLTLYDYLTLLPALITAVATLTPLILGLKNKGKKDESV